MLANIMGTRKAFLPGITRDLCDVNLAVLGAIGVGKSALTVRYLTKRYLNEYSTTLEDTYSKAETLGGSDINVRVMDTYDSEVCANSDRYLKWATGYIVVYSMMNVDSFEIARQYLSMLRGSSDRRPLMLVGNKSDMERYRTVSRAQGHELSMEFDAQFREVSAAEEPSLVEAVFLSVIREICGISSENTEQLFIHEERSPARRRKAGQSPRRSGPSFKIFNKKPFKLFN